MSEHLQNLIFGISVSFIVPVVTFALGMAWSKLIGGWQDLKFRKWWTTFCLLIPLAGFGMMTKRMAQDNFEGLRAMWSAEPFHLVIITVVVVLLSMIVVVALFRLWRTPHSRRNC